MTTHPTETEIKGSLLQHWRMHARLKKSDVIASELVLGRLQCRADLAIWNGQLIGIEIKSSRDKLLRLPKQISAYNIFFDRVIVVADERHISDIMQMPDNSFEIWQAKAHGKLELIREGFSRPIATNFNRSQLLKLPELRKLLGERAEKTARRSELEEMCKTLPPQQLHAAVVKSFCDSFSANTQEFWDRIGRRRIAASDVKSLSRFAETREHQKLRQSTQLKFWERWQTEAARHLHPNCADSSRTTSFQQAPPLIRLPEYADGY